MIQVTNKDTIVGPGHSTGKTREGRFYKESSYSSCLQIKSHEGTFYTLVTKNSFVVKGNARLPITKKNGNIITML